MLNGVHFYHATIKRVVSVFGTIFNNIVVGRHSGNKISNIMRVPISYGPRAKFLDRMNESLENQRVALKLPRMSFEITSIDYDTSTKLNRLNRTLSTGSNSPNKRTSMYQSVPYTLGMQLNIMARNQEDALQIVEQILPTFSPEYTVAIKGIEGPDSKTDVPFILNSVSFSDDYESTVESRRTIIYTLDFTVRIRFAPDTSKLSIINRVSTDIADFSNVVNTTDADQLTTINVNQDSPSGTLRTFTSLIDPDDVQKITFIPSDINLSGLSNLGTISSINTISGTGADIGRLANDDTDISFPLLSSSGSGIGTGASFSTIVNGLTGQTTGVSINDVGLKFAINDTITISQSPYHNTNLVLSVTGVNSPHLDSPNSNSPYGEITSFSITSGDAANSDTIANYNPTFVRENLGGNISAGTSTTGFGSRFDVSLDKTGAITNISVDSGGFSYSSDNQITIPGSLLGDTDGTATDLVIGVAGINDITMSGKYSRVGRINNYPSYSMNSPTSGSNSPKDNSSLLISYTGTEWQLKQDTKLIATNGADSLVLPTSGWVNRIIDSDTITATIPSGQLADFTIGEFIQGGSTLGQSIVLTSSNEIVTVNNAEAQYLEGELVTGLTSGVTRMVFNMDIKQ